MNVPGLAAPIALLLGAAVSGAGSESECVREALSIELDAGVEGVRLRTPRGVPVTGQPFALQLFGGPPFAPARVAIGRAVSEVILPDLGAAWFVGSPQATISVVLDENGTSPELVTDGFGPSSCGIELVAQAAVGDAGGGIAQVSNAVRARVGRPPAFVFPGMTVLVELAEAVTTGDFDGDGHADLAAAGGTDSFVTVALGEGTGVFRNSDTVFLPTDGAHAIVTADFTEDGVPDLAVAAGNYFAIGKVFVLRGAGDGTFSVLGDYAVGARPLALVVGDWNGDGHADLATANSQEGDVSVLLGTGRGGFASQPPFDLDPGASSLTSGDYNDDGVPDLAVDQGSVIALLLGDGDGRFERVDVPLDPAPFDLATGDLDDDGYDDLVVTQNFNFVSVLLGAGDGSFATAAVEQSPVDPLAPLVRDFDGDGHLDVAVTHDSTVSWGKRSIRVFPGKGDGFLEPGLEHVGRGGGFDIAAGDWNEDGRVDVALPNDLREVELLFGRGDGTFAPDATDLEGHGPHVSVADLNGDTLPDIVCWEFHETVRVYLQGEGGAFEQSFHAPLGDGVGDGVVGDWTEDGIPDLASATGFREVFVAQGNGDGTFGEAVAFAAHELPRTVAAADLDADGDPDLIVANSFSDDLSVLLGRPGLDFEPAVHYPAVEFEGVPFPLPLTGDVDGDGDVDVVVGDGKDEVYLGLGDGQGSLVPAPAPLALTPMTPSALADVDQDGHLDLVAFGHKVVHVFEGVGDGSFGSEYLAATDFNAKDAQAGDVDGDGVVDLVTGGHERLVVLRGLGGFAFDEPVAYATRGSVHSLALADLDLDGNLDAVASNLTVLLNRSGEPVASAGLDPVD